ncbi:MAG: hypothetical protein ABIV50_12960, partial [Opitutus sp.]
AAIALPVTLIAVGLGSRHGTLGVARAVTVASVILALPRLWWVLRGLPYGLAEYLSALARPLAIMAITTTAIYSGAHYSGGETWAARLITGVGCGGLAAIAVAGIWPQLRSEWQMVTHHLPLPRRNRARSSSP